MSQPGEMPRTEVDASEADPSLEPGQVDGDVTEGGPDDAGADTTEQRDADMLQLQEEDLPESVIDDVLGS